MRNLLLFVAVVVLIAIGCYIHRPSVARKNFGAFVRGERVLGFKIWQWMLAILLVAVAAGAVLGR